MTLDKYLKMARLSVADFARQIGVSPVSAYRYVSGERTPAKPIMVKIKEVTHGAVTPNDFFVEG